MVAEERDRVVSNRFAIVIATLALVACAKEPISSTPVGNDIDVELLFEHDGCKVYRFSDAGRFVYYTTCTSTAWTDVEHHHNGKTTTQRDIPRAVVTYRRRS